MKIYRRLETPKLYANIKAENIDSDGNLSDGNLTNPAGTTQIIIENELGEVVQALADMSGGGATTGKFYYTGYTIAVNAKPGTYNYEVRALDGSSNMVIGKGSFQVEEQIA